MISLNNLDQLIAGLSSDDQSSIDSVFSELSHLSSQDPLYIPDLLSKLAAHYLVDKRLYYNTVLSFLNLSQLLLQFHPQVGLSSHYKLFLFLDNVLSVEDLHAFPNSLFKLSIPSIDFLPRNLFKKATVFFIVYCVFIKESFPSSDIFDILGSGGLSLVIRELDNLSDKRYDQLKKKCSSLFKLFRSTFNISVQSKNRFIHENREREELPRGNIDTYSDLEDFIIPAE
ncbi:hypothetical protein GEMRC1_013707 [Eukaryota sp. GEM-RC1]